MTTKDSRQGQPETVGCGGRKAPDAGAVCDATGSSQVELPREVVEAVVRWTASFSGILLTQKDRQWVNAALLDVAHLAYRAVRSETGDKA